MENLNLITSFFARIWELFSLQHPVIGIPFSVIYLGTFAIAFSITILKPILGIGYGLVGDIKPDRNQRANRKYQRQLRREYKRNDREIQAQMNRYYQRHNNRTSVQISKSNALVPK